VLEWGLSFGVVSFVEGIILVATPALIRDFAPQVGRATAMGFWTIGPVLGSLAVSAVNTLTLPTYQTWQSQFVICGVVGLVVFVLAFLFLRELAPALRDQLMVSERDRVLVELKAKGLDIEASLRNPWRQMMHVDVIASALGVSVMLLAYYTAVGFGLIYLVTVFQFSVAQANALANWTWGANALALIVAGVVSDRLRVRKPFMLAGGIGGAMDIAAGSKKLIVCMEHNTKEGAPKIVKACNYPLTGLECVDTIVTDLAVIDVTPEGLVLRETAPGWTPEEVQARTEAKLIIRNKVLEMILA